MTNYIPASIAMSGEHAQEMAATIGPWIIGFCEAHGFVKKGRTNAARAMTLLNYGEPRTKAERHFLDALLLEMARRYPGDTYPPYCVRLASAAVH
ncbi:hypothetical protein PE067_08760 [Paracoccus sp. DMF-8]|uniref:hypothetical protein n=1 Tax=Paracoccus sp. DMF-8 TaxID=3019445 RepID=UPI0023E834E2|nr:hypothetical protein [Paracoccus sp. DMF-8]MDF3606214.1 hypothetical protein [Paracoccus sp. DMF-8]